MIYSLNENSFSDYNPWRKFMKKSKESFHSVEELYLMTDLKDFLKNKAKRETLDSQLYWA